MLELNVNGYVPKSRNSILRNPYEPIASLSGIQQAATEEPGVLSAHSDVAKQLNKKGPPEWLRAVEEAQASGLFRGSVWRELRDNLNPGAVTNTMEKIKEARERVAAEQPRGVDLNEQEFGAQEAKRTQERNRIAAESNRIRAKSGKSRVAQNVFNAYKSSGGHNMKAVRKAYIRFAG
jgi:hypothetical protein